MLKLPSNGGFTLLETLLVLSITTIVIAITTMSITKVNANNQLNQVVLSFTNDYESMRLNSLKTKAKSEIIFSKNGYQVYYQNDLIKTVNTNNIEISNNYTNSLSTNKNGNINRAGTVSFTNKYKTKDVVFFLGEGNYEIK